MVFIHSRKTRDNRKKKKQGSHKLPPMNGHFNKLSSRDWRRCRIQYKFWQPKLEDRPIWLRRFPKVFPIAISVVGEWYSIGRYGSLIHIEEMKLCFSASGLKLGIHVRTRRGSEPILHREVRSFTLSLSNRLKTIQKFKPRWRNPGFLLSFQRPKSLS